MSEINVDSIAKVVGITTNFVNLKGGVTLLPQHVGIIGQGNSAAIYSTAKKQFTRSIDVANEYGFGSPVHLAAKQLFPDNGDGVGTIPVTVFPLVDDAAGVPAIGDVALTGTATESATLFVKINNIKSEAINVLSGENGDDLEDRITDAINAILDMPVTAVAEGVAHTSDLTSKWEGVSANGIVIEWEGAVAGITQVITPMAGGLVNPDVQDALDLFGESTWYTMVLNCNEIADTTSLDKYDSFGEGRWGALIRKPLVVFTGNTELTVALATAVSDVRTLDRTNVQMVAPGSNDLPFVVAARQLARVVVRANNNPPFAYGGLRADGLVPGADEDQWTFADRDSAIKKGSSGIEVVDGEIVIADIATFYHPLGDPTPAYRYVVDIVKLMTVIFNLDLIFTADEWNSAPLIPDDQPTTNSAAKQPKMAIAEMARMVDSLGLEAIISDPVTAKKSLTAGIDAGNPKRLNTSLTVQVSGNTKVNDTTLNWGFFFGIKPIAA